MFGPTFTPPEEKAFRGSKHRSSQGMTGGFWKTRLLYFLEIPSIFCSGNVEGFDSCAFFFEMLEACVGWFRNLDFPDIEQGIVGCTPSNVPLGEIPI